MSCYNHVMHLIGLVVEIYKNILKLMLQKQLRILGKFDEFDESGSNHQTKTNQSKTIAISRASLND